MLVLSRKVGERIHIGDEIVLEIRRITGNRVTLALAAPRDVRILRGELDKAAREFAEPKQRNKSESETVLQITGPLAGVLESVTPHSIANHSVTH